MPEVPYTETDLAYYTNGRADQEQNDPSARPAIAGKVENMEEYDTIILGYPIWHGLCPDSVNWMEGKRYEAGTMKETMENRRDLYHAGFTGNLIYFLMGCRLMRHLFSSQ